MTTEISLKKRRKPFFFLLVFLAFFSLFFVTSIRDAQACHGCCTICNAADCAAAQSILNTWHDMGESAMLAWITMEFNMHKEWLLNTFFLQEVLPALMRMTEQMSAVAMQQVFIIGTFMDAEHQLETQRIFQELQAQAHKDYQPSEDFCWIGTNVRSLAASERAGQFSALALNARQIKRHLGHVNTVAAANADHDKFRRWKEFINEYCDPQDNNWNGTESGSSGLVLACGAGGGNTERINIDIDYTRLLEEPRTLDVAFDEDRPNPTEDEQDIIALGNNLYGHDVLRRVPPASLLGQEGQQFYMALRSVAAKRSVAENSYNAIIALKTAGASTVGADNTANFLGAVMAELGVPPAEIYQIIGDRPSYYAQLEILAKKIYQTPDFYSNLYDKPANIARKSVALKAIELMLDRAIYESQIRQEMASSVLLSARLRDNFRDVNEDLSGGAAR